MTHFTIRHLTLEKSQETSPTDVIYIFSLSIMLFIYQNHLVTVKDDSNSFFDEFLILWSSVKNTNTHTKTSISILSNWWFHIKRRDTICKKIWKVIYQHCDTFSISKFSPIRLLLTWLQKFIIAGVFFLPFNYLLYNHFICFHKLPECQ